MNTYLKNCLRYCEPTIHHAQCTTLVCKRTTIWNISPFHHFTISPFHHFTMRIRTVTKTMTCIHPFHCSSVSHNLPSLKLVTCMEQQQRVCPLEETLVQADSLLYLNVSVKDQLNLIHSRKDQLNKWRGGTL